MSRKSSFLIALVVALAAGAARADEPGVQVFAGVGAGMLGVDACPPGSTMTGSYSCSDGVRHRWARPAPVYGIEWIGLADTAGRAQLRYGGELSGALVMGDMASAGGSISALGKLGLRSGRFFADAGGGLSILWIDTGDYQQSQGTMSVHASVGASLSQRLSLALRADAHAMMHAEMAAAFLGSTLTWDL